MIRPDYREIYHYGIPRRSGRYPWGSGERPYQSREEKAARMERRLSRKFERADARTERLQQRANRKFNKANQQRNSMFEFRREAAQDTFDEGYELQEKKQRIEYKMSKKYERYLNKFEVLDVKMSDELRTKGAEYCDRVLKTTDEQYKAALIRRVS